MVESNVKSLTVGITDEQVEEIISNSDKTTITQRMLCSHEWVIWKSILSDNRHRICRKCYKKQTMSKDKTNNWINQ